MTDVPGLMPVTTPVDEPTAATAMVPLLHVPPDGLQASAVVPPTQTVNVPVIGPGDATTTMVMETEQPVGKV